MGERGHLCRCRSRFNASSTLAIPCAFMSSVCVCVCAHVCVCVLGLCPAKYMCLLVCVCVTEGVRVFFNNTTERVIHFRRTNSGIQFDRCETSQRNVFIAVEKEFTVVVNIPLSMSIYYPITNLSSVYT